MSTKHRLPERVHEKHGAYYLVTTVEGGKRKWSKLCRVKDGLPAMYLALAEKAKDKGVGEDMMPKLVAAWMLEVGITHSKKTQANDRTHNRVISESFAEFRAGQVKPTDVTTFLKPYKGMPRSYNAYRAALRERMRFAEEKGHRPPGSNPVDSIKTMKTPPRTRYITDSELRRIKAAACRGDDGLRTRSGHTFCCLIDMAYLTGQRVGDLLMLEWTDVKPNGIYFEPGKTEGSTGVKILIEWTPKLRAVVDRLKNPPPLPINKKKPEQERTKAISLRWVFSTLKGTRYSYDAIKSAWARARTRAKLTNAHFHDLRAKALTDVDEDRDIKAAQGMGGHSTQTQTADYIRNKKAKKISATR